MVKLWIISVQGMERQIGGGAKYDISMVFVYAAFDRYLKENGKLAFLITQSVFQSDAGYG